MSLRIIFVAGVAAVTVQGGAASAQGLFTFGEAEGGAYVSGFLGAGFPSDAAFRGVQNPEAGAPGVVGAPANVDVSFDTGAVFGGAVGYQLPMTYWRYFHPRLELEASYLAETDVSDGAFNGGDQTFGGSQETLFILINNYSDIRWSPDQMIVPYVGGGLGLGRVDANIPYAPAGAGAPTFTVVGDDTGLATTFAGGVTVDVPGAAELFGEARYYQVHGVELERRFIADGADLFNASVEDDLSGVTLTAGARWRF